MANQLGSDFEAFVHFAESQLGNQDAELTPEQCLALYRSQHPRAAELSEGIAAVNEALEAMHAGDTGQPLEEFDRQFRLRNKLPTDG